MKEKLIAILTALVALAKVDPEEQRIIKAQKDEIEKLKAEVATAHGDSELNDPQVKALIDEASEVLAAAQPNDDHLDNEPTNIELPPEEEPQTDPDENQENT